jgi:hypothetical protein
VTEKKKENRGRKTLLTPELGKSICDMISAVATIKEASHANGLAETTVHEWIQKGNADPDSVYGKFAESIRHARSRRTMSLKAQIRGHGKRDWRALMALGAVTDPAEFVPQIRIHVTQELDSILARLEEAFANEPETFERALRAISSGSSRNMAVQTPVEPSGADPGGGEAVHPASTEPETEGVP